MISLHVRQYRAKLAKAVRLTDQASTDVKLARSRWEDALDSEMTVAAEVSAVEAAAAAELNELPQVTGYGRVRTRRRSAPPRKSSTSGSDFYNHSPRLANSLPVGRHLS